MSDHAVPPELKDVLVAGELARATRRALAIFDEWQRVTGCLDGSSYVWELEGIVSDAVEIGVQAAYGIHSPLDSEQDATESPEALAALPALVERTLPDGTCPRCGTYEAIVGDWCTGCNVRVTPAPGGSRETPQEEKAT